MKRSKRLWSVLAVLLVIIITTTSLVACGGSKKMKVEDFTEMLSEGLAKTTSPEDGYYFNLDTQVSYLYEKDANKTRYDFVLKGTLDTKPGKATYDNQLFLELKQTVNSEATKTLLGLYYDESECNDLGKYDTTAPLLFVNIVDKYKFSYDSYSIKKLVNDLNPTAAAVSDEEEAGPGIGEIIMGFLPTLIDQMVVEGSVKTSTKKKEVTTTAILDINGLLSFAVSMLSGLNVGDKSIGEIIDSLDLGFTLEDLGNISIDAPITLTFVYEKAKKNEFGKLLRASIGIDIKRDHDINISLGETKIISSEENSGAILPIIGKIQSGKVMLSFDKLVIESGAKLNIPELATIKADKKFKKINIANIAIDGKVKFSSSDPKDSKVVEYDLVLRADVNPIPLAFMTSDWDTKNNVFSKIGALHLAIRNADKSKSMIELAYDPNSASGSDYVFVSLNIGAGIIANVKMDASALEGLMNALVKKVNPPKTEDASDVMSVASGDINNIAPSIGDFLNDLIVDGTIKGIMDMIDPKLWDQHIDKDPNTEDQIGKTIEKVVALVKEMTKEGGAIKVGTVDRGTQKNGFIELNFSSILDQVNKAFNLGGIIDTIKGLIGSLLGGDILNVEITTDMSDVSKWYGATPANYNAFQHVRGNNGRSTDNIVAKVDGIKGLTAGQSITHAEFAAKFEVGKDIQVTGKALSGKDAPVSIAYNDYRVFMIDGYDNKATGSQTIRIAVQDKKNGVDGILGALGSIVGDLDLSNYPIGFEAFEITINFTK